MRETRKFIFTSVDSIASVVSSHGNQGIVDQLDTIQFVLLLGSLLTFDPHRRATPSHILQHPFITMQHLATHTNTSRLVIYTSSWLCVCACHNRHGYQFTVCCQPIWPMTMLVMGWSFILVSCNEFHSIYGTLCYVCSVRDWIQCMQVCVQSKTTHSFSPSAHTHPYTPPPPPILLPHHTTTTTTLPFYSPSSLTYFPLPSSDLQAMTSSISSQVGTVPWPHPSSLTGYPSRTRWALDGTNNKTSVAVDTGYVSGDPSPAAVSQLVNNYWCVHSFVLITLW